MNRRAPVVLCSAVVVFLGFASLAAYGAYRDAQHQRVLSELEPVIDVLRESGARLTRWGLDHKLDVVRAGGVAGALLAMAAVLGGGWRALPISLLVAAATLAAAGQALLLQPEGAFAVGYYLGGTVLALLFGLWCPAPARPEPVRPLLWVDGLLVVCLTLCGTALRLYALPELPATFAGEMGLAMLASRTLAGIQQFIPGALHGTSIGIMHLLPQWAFFEMFGTSVYSLRLTAVAASTLTTFLFYWLLRSMGGRAAAVIGCTLLITAPEQLWWSRGENVNYAMVSLAGVASASLGWWLRQHLSLGAAAAMAAWMPFTRLFYLAAVTLVAYPWMLLTHSLFFQPRLWRRILASITLILVGTLLWVCSLSIVRYAVVGGPWRFLNPAQHGELVSRRDVEARRSSLGELLRRQADSLRVNLTKVGSALTYRGGFSQWYDRADDVRNPTWINVAVTATVALSIAYLLAQLYTPPAGVLLCWVVVGLLPAVLSTAPDDRRMGMTFPALYACAGFAVTAWWRVVRNHTARVVSWLWGAAGVVAIAAMALSSLSSHLKLPVEEMALVQAQRRSKEIFEKSDAIYYDGDETGMMLILLGHADRFLDRKPCVEGIGPRDWLAAILRQPCSFEGVAFRMTMSPAEREALRREPRKPQRVTFFPSLAPHSQPATDLLRQIFPDAEEELSTRDVGLSHRAFTVDRAALDARRRPLALIPPGVTVPRETMANLMAETAVEVRSGDESAGSEIVVRGGMLVESEDWYRVGLLPDCAGASFRIDNHPVHFEGPLYPLLAGIHPFEVRLETPIRCALPLRIAARGSEDGSATSTATLVSAQVAEAPAARAPEMTLYEGYVDAGLLEGVRGAVIDARATPAGEVMILGRTGESYTVQRFDAAGIPQEVRPVPLPAGVTAHGFAVAADRAMLLVTDVGLFFWEYPSAQIVAWASTPFHNPEIGFLPDGRILAAIPEHASIEVFERDGSPAARFETFAGGPGHFVEPVSVALAPEGRLLVVGQTDGTMIVFHLEAGKFLPQYFTHFRKDFTMSSVLPRSLTFDGPERIMAGDPERHRVLVHTPQGVRLMARDPRQDWAAITRRIGEVRRFVPTSEYLYVLAGEPGLRRFRR